MVSVIGMTFLHDARYSVVLLRQKNEVKPLTQSAEKWICMGKWASEILAELFLKIEKTSDVQFFSGAGFATNAVPNKNSARQLC